MAAAAGSHTRILAGLVIGAAIGTVVNWLVRQQPDLIPARDFVVRYITQSIGQMFINLLFLAIIPLVFASLALGVTRLGGENIGRIGVKTIAYFILTTACAAVIGLSFVNTIRPGDTVSDELKTRLMSEYSQAPEAKDRKPSTFGLNTFINVVPGNPLRAFVEKEMLAVIFTALLVGVALTRIEPRYSKPIIDLLEGVNAVTEFIIRTAIAVAPIGVFCLVFSITAKFGTELLGALAVFVGTVLAGLAVQLLVVFPLLVKFLGGMSPIDFFIRSKAPMITAFSTRSSSATLPTALKCAEEDLAIPPSIARFVLPLSASMNHNGSALFEAVTAVFLCQVFGVDLSLQQEIVLLVMCVLTSAGMAGVPGGSMPLIGLVVASVAPQVPAAAIGIVIGIDVILDMCRTMVNVTGDLTTVVYIKKSEAGRIAEPPPVEV